MTTPTPDKPSAAAIRIVDAYYELDAERKNETDPIKDDEFCAAIDAELSAERAAAKAVMAHSEHFRDCDSLYTMAGLPTPPCTCGLDARRAEYLRLIGEKP